MLGVDNHNWTLTSTLTNYWVYKSHTIKVRTYTWLLTPTSNTILEITHCMIKYPHHGLWIFSKYYIIRRTRPLGAGVQHPLEFLMNPPKLLKRQYFDEFDVRSFFLAVSWCAAQRWKPSSFSFFCVAFQHPQSKNHPRCLYMISWFYM